MTLLADTLRMCRLEYEGALTRAGDLCEAMEDITLRGSLVGSWLGLGRKCRQISLIGRDASTTDQPGKCADSHGRGEFSRQTADL